jgi:hypothetical protein
LLEEVVMGDSQGIALISVDARGILRWEDKAGKRRALYLREGDTAQIGREVDNDVV